MQRQKGSLLYERLALSKDKQKVLELAGKGQVIRTGKDLVIVGSQVRLTLDETHFYPDLVFYNRLAK